MKIFKIIVKIISIIVVGWIMFKLIIPNIGFSLWMFDSTKIKYIVIMGYLAASLIEIFKLGGHR